MAVAAFIEILDEFAPLAIAAVCAWILSFANARVPNPSIFGWHPFSFLHHDFDSWIDDVVRWGTGFLGHMESTTSATALRQAQRDRIQGYLNERIVRAVRYHSQHSIPNAEGAAKAFARTHVGVEAHTRSSQIGTVQREIAHAEGEIKALRRGEGAITWTGIENKINASESHAVSTSESYTDKAVGAEAQALSSRLSSVWSAIDGLQGAVNSTIPAELQQQARAEAAALAAQAQAEKAALNQAVDQLRTELDQAIAAGQTAEAQSLAQQIDQITNQLDTLEQTTTQAFPVIGEIAGAATITVPLAVAGLASEVASIATEMDDCMVTTCEGPNNLEGLLQKALGGVQLAALVGVFAEMINDPKGEATVVSKVADGLYTDAHALIDTVLSL